MMKLLLKLKTTAYNMKKSIAIILFMVFASPAFTQDTTRAKARRDDPQVQERIKAARAAYITERLELTSSQAEKFWPVYREFADKREAIHKKLRDARQTGKEDEAMVQLYHKVRQEELDLEKSYSGKFLQVISASQLVKLHESDREFRKLMVRQVLRNRKEVRRKEIRHDRN
jgi:hypothetical protein